VGWSEAITEFHIVGGLHPELTLDWYCEMLRGLKHRFPGVHLKAFTMVEIAYLARRGKITIRQTLEKLKDAGMDSMPGGGAEIFSERVRRIICDHKIDGGEWLEVAREAHRLGLRSNCTMLYGHVETEEDRVDHLLKLRALQDETGGFQTFIPLAFHPENTPLHHLPKTSGFDDIRNIAVARLLLDNIEHIKAYWVMMTPAIAQIALRFGADDLDGTVVEEKIYHDAGATTSQALRRSELLRLIREAGREPVERDTLYRPVQRVESISRVPEKGDLTCGIGAIRSRGDPNRVRSRFHGGELEPSCSIGACGCDWRTGVRVEDHGPARRKLGKFLSFQVQNSHFYQDNALAGLWPVGGGKQNSADSRLTDIRGRASSRLLPANYDRHERHKATRKNGSSGN